MARMSIDDAVTRAPEFDHLAELVGWHRRETAMCVIEIWAICYDRITPNLQPRDIETTARRGARVPPSADFVPAMIECGLARYATKFDTAFVTPKGERIEWRDQEWKGRVTIRGAAERIAYLIKNKQSGAVGGKRSGESRRDSAKRPFDENGSVASQGAQASANPSVPDPVVASASASASAPDVANSEKNSATPSAGGPRSRKPKPSEPTADERSSALFVLRKLTDRSGVRYSGTDEHVRLIVRQFRSGVTEADLRKVIGYCAVELDWEDNPDMAKYLRPETLFGPKTISKYLDAARDWFAKQGLELEPRPLLEAVP